MANCEYQESDIMFPEDSNQDKYLLWPPQQKNSAVLGTSRRKINVDNKRQKKLTNYSLPICILERDHFDWEGEFEIGEGWDGETDVVPPHVIVARRLAARNMEFSVCSGKGRTLKGRDLIEVRNEILRMTGFLEAN